MSEALPPRQAVPGAAWGSPQRSLLATLTGDAEVEALLTDEAMLMSMIAFEVALAAAEAEAGLIAKEAADAIADGLSAFAPDWHDLALGMARDGVAVPALVTQLRAVLPERVASSLHHGATSQDVVDTAIILQLAKVIPILLARLAALAGRLRRTAADSGSRRIMAHTRMQAALPFTVADKIRTWTEPLERMATTLSGMRRQLLVIQLGGPVGDRASFSGQGAAVAKGLARRLDLGIAEPWHSTRDPIVTFASQLSQISGSLGKLGMDVTLMSQTEVGAIALRNQGRSSSMAHKANPVGAEVLVALARHTAGLVGTMHHALIHENERSGSAWTLEWLTLPPIIVATAAGLRIALQIANDITFAS